MNRRWIERGTTASVIPINFFKKQTIAPASAAGRRPARGLHYPRTRAGSGREAATEVLAPPDAWFWRVYRRRYSVRAASPISNAPRSWCRPIGSSRQSGNRATSERRGAARRPGAQPSARVDSPAAPAPAPHRARTTGCVRSD